MQRRTPYDVTNYRMNQFQASFLLAGKVCVQAVGSGCASRLLIQHPRHLFWQQLLYLGCSTVQAEAPSSKLTKRLSDGIASFHSILPSTTYQCLDALARFSEACYCINLISCPSRQVFHLSLQVPYSSHPIERFALFSRCKQKQPSLYSGIDPHNETISQTLSDLQGFKLAPSCSVV